MATTLPKYAQTEIERRWLVDLEAVGPLEAVAFREIEDRYLPGTRLRLRKMHEASGKPILKLCKKYGKFSALSEPVANLYLSEAEYALLAQLGGAAVRKRRYAIAGGALDLYDGQDKLAVFEAEFESEAQALAYIPPSFVRAEITNNPSFSGTALASRVD
jgi:CYTH domain-containing protein